MLDWAAIDTVLLDMDGTLLDLHFDNHFWLEHLPRYYAATYDGSEKQARQHLLARLEKERGTLNWYCLDYWSEQLKLDIPALKLEIKHLIKIRPYVQEFLQRLQQGHQQVILVTNAHRKGLEIKLNHTGLGTLVDNIVVSHDYLTPKEDPNFWQHMHKAHPFDPDKTLLIDDNASVLKSAQQHGIRHLLTMLQPDSQQAQRQHSQYPGILHFDEIMPAITPQTRGQ
ncbi:MAG: GMP/IMP nucleotidase [Spongiibacteraceae bacterium]|nr:GMP/IMP nucleotidase [Spongiibacteraceae bacterium]